MVAKISFGSSLFGALAYNQEKVDEGEGKVLGTNKVLTNADGTVDMHACMRDFESRMPAHIQTRKPIVHISLNPHPDDRLSDEQLAAIATEYLEKMGYGNQPYVVYKHEDISRHHIHIVTLGVDEQGKKISDSNNFFNSKKITRALEQKYGLLPAEKQKQTEGYRYRKVNPDEGNIKKQVASVIVPLMKFYKFQSFNEYRSLLSLYNIGMEEVKGEVKGKPYNGIVYSATDDKGNKVGNSFKSSLFGKVAGNEALQKRIEQSKTEIKDKRLGGQTKQTILAAISKHPDRAGLEKELSQKGIDVLFRQNETGRIYGVTFVDHNCGCVFNGSRLGKEFSANTFQEMFTNPHPVTTQVQSHEAVTPTFERDSYEQEGDSLIGSVLDMPLESHGTDPEEEAFRRRMQRKKRKTRGI